MGNPFEWLRSMARGRVDDDDLAAEAAGALTMLAADPAGLVVACRRLLGHHPDHGALWWVVSNVLSAADPSAAARQCTAKLDADRTAGRLSGALPFLSDGEVVGVAGWPPAVATALDERIDLDVLAVVDPDDHRSARAASQRAELVDAWELTDREVSHLLVAALALSPASVIVSRDAADCLEECRTAAAWLVTGVGRLLPERLYAAVETATRGDDDLVVVPTSRFLQVIGPAGVDHPKDLASRVDCPIAPELLRPLDP